MDKETAELIFTRINQLQEQVDGLEAAQNGLIKRLQNMLFKAWMGSGRAKEDDA